MEEKAHHFINLPQGHHETARTERGFNVSQIVTYEYCEKQDGSPPVMQLVIAGGQKLEYQGEDAKRIYVSIRGKW